MGLFSKNLPLTDVPKSIGADAVWNNQLLLNNGTPQILSLLSYFFYDYKYEASM